MNLKPLLPFLKQSSLSTDILVKYAANNLLQTPDPDAEEIIQPAIYKQEVGRSLNNKQEDEIDQAMNQVMPDLDEDDKNLKSEFGKTASAYIADIEVGSLPKATQEDIIRFAPQTNKSTKVVQYGFVVSELLPMTDVNNYRLAKEHIKAEYNKNKKALADKFQTKVNNKYILLLNDSIIDGHHMLAMADVLGISCSLKVLDLTVIRFQQIKKASLLESIMK